MPKKKKPENPLWWIPPGQRSYGDQEIIPRYGPGYFLDESMPMVPPYEYPYRDYHYHMKPGMHFDPQKILRLVMLLRGLA